MNLRSILSFLSFSTFTRPDAVETLLITHHKKWASQFDHWTMESTLKRLEGDYWNFLVRVHFACIAILLFISLLFIKTGLAFWQTAAGFIAIIIVIFVILKYLLYKPRYEQYFVPLLHNSLQHLTATNREALSKAKSGQYKAFTLLLIQYVFQKLSGYSKLSDGKIQRELLCRQYGISNDTLDAPLKNLLSKPYDEQHPKMQTQIMDYFGEAKDYFDALGSKGAIDLLEEMKIAVLHGKKLPF